MPFRLLTLYHFLVRKIQFQPNYGKITLTSTKTSQLQSCFDHFASLNLAKSKFKNLLYHRKFYFRKLYRDTTDKLFLWTIWKDFPNFLCMSRNNFWERERQRERTLFKSAVFRFAFRFRLHLSSWFRLCIKRISTMNTENHFPFNFVAKLQKNSHPRHIQISQHTIIKQKNEIATTSKTYLNTSKHIYKMK